MTTTYDDEEMPLPLLHRSAPKERNEAEDDMPLRRDYRAVRSPDRMRPATAGALAGVFGGAAALGVVQLVHLEAISAGIGHLADRLAVPPDASTPLAYLAAAVSGAFVGAGFAFVTRHLRRSFVAVLVWAVVFFVSLTMLLLALSSSYGHGQGVAMAPAILLASAVYAVVVSFQLPLRRRA